MLLCKCGWFLIVISVWKFHIVLDSIINFIFKEASLCAIYLTDNIDFLILFILALAAQGCSIRSCVGEGACLSTLWPLVVCNITWLAVI